MHLRSSEQRGHTALGWLDSRHSFSFGHYRDPGFMGFGHLRVINQDVVMPGRGFGTHGHRDMEIISVVLRGGLAHADSLGTGSVIRPHEVQLMSAGRGVSHSELNASRAEPVEFLQIWVTPNQRGAEPRYQQRAFDPDQRGLVRVVSPDGADDSLVVRQDMSLLQLRLDGGARAQHAIERDRAWVQVVGGDLEVNGVALRPGDGLAIDGGSSLRFVAAAPVEALVFDLQ